MVDTDPCQWNSGVRVRASQDNTSTKTTTALPTTTANRLHQAIITAIHLHQEHTIIPTLTHHGSVLRCTTRSVLLQLTTTFTQTLLTLAQITHSGPTHQCRGGEVISVELMAQAMTDTSAKTSMEIWQFILLPGQSMLQKTDMQLRILGTVTKVLGVVTTAT